MEGSVRYWTPAFLPLFILAAYPAVCGSQTLIRIAEDDACPDCRIELEPVATLRPPAERVGFVVLPSSSVARDRDGRFVAGLVLGEAAIAVFGPDGSFSHVFGRFGQGPGEFSDGRMFVRIGAGDTVHVFQSIVHSVWSPGARAFLDSRRLQVRPFDVVLQDGRTIVRAAVHGPGGTGIPVHVLAEDGTVATGIGRVNGQDSSMNPVDWVRRLARARRDRSVWVAQWKRYEISRFDLSGREETKLVREAAWFPPRTDPVEAEGYLTRARPTVEGLVESSEGTLWVVISRGDPAYDPPELPRGVEGEPLDPYQDDNGRLDTVIEVLDVTRGRLLARAELDPYMRFIDTPDDEPLLYSMRTIETGEVVVDIWRATLLGRP